MATVPTCLKDIAKVREVASGAEQAYVARSRLARLILRSTSVARGVIGVSMVGVMNRQTCDNAARILKTCEQFYACHRSATHASEPLDERWQLTWQEILFHLDTLQTLLEEQCDEHTTTEHQRRRLDT